MKKKKPFIGVLVAKKYGEDQWAYIPYFGAAMTEEEAVEEGLCVFNDKFPKSWRMIFNNATEMIPEEYKKSIEGIDL